jgi:probable HAF family extracellular repeat protein
MRDLIPLGGHSWAEAINNLGQVAGAVAPTPDGFPMHAFRWTPTEGARDLGTLGGDCSRGAGINDLGQVAGTAATSTPDPTGDCSGKLHAFRWTPSTGMQDLGTLGGADASDYSEAHGIDRLGRVWGSAGTASGQIDAVVWSP